MDLYDYLDKNPTEKLDIFISYYKSNSDNNRFIINDTVIKLASTPKVSQDILCFLLEQYFISKNDMHILLNSSVCNFKTMEALLVCIENNTIYSSILFNSIYYSIQTNNISSFYFLTNTLFASTLLPIVKKYIEMYKFSELYGYCMKYLQSFNVEPFMHQLLKCDIPINKNILIWLVSDKYYVILSECFKNKCNDIDMETIEIVFYILLQNKEINDADSIMIVNSIPNVDFIPLSIQKHLNYININTNINTNIENNKFVTYLFNYYETESLNKLTMYTIINNIYSKISKVIKSVFQYFFKH
jgi:hypothetical protein